MVSYLKEKHQEPKIKHRRPISQKRTPQLVKNILDAIVVDHLSVRKACKANGISDGTFLQWVADDNSLAEQYTKAMRVRTDTMAMEILDIVDDVAEDDIFDENGNRKANNEWINRSRLRMEGRKWIVSKLMPKKYGDHLQLDTNANVTHSGGTVNVNISTDPVQASRDYQDFIKGKK